MAERVGFEPTKGLSPLTRLAIERLRPLGHLSPLGEKMITQRKAESKPRSACFFSIYNRKNFKNDQDIICFVLDSAVCPIFKKNGLSKAKFIFAFLTDYKGFSLENQQS